jgi:hypothetical protein
MPTRVSLFDLDGRMTVGPQLQNLDTLLTISKKKDDYPAQGNRHVEVSV